jgi:hypothetical protein
MWISGDVTCLHCGFVSGLWSGVQGARITYKRLEPRPAGADRDAEVRCRWCDGPVYLREDGHARLSYRVHRTPRHHRRTAVGVAAFASSASEEPAEAEPEE